jgi:putative acetyltransferase
MAERLTVEVNEQNSAALAFYRAQGFEIVGRSVTDRSGLPYPLLHLEESADAPARRRQSHS